MTGKDLLKCMSFVDSKYIEEAEKGVSIPEKQTEPVRKVRSKLFLIAATIGLMVFLMGSAVVVMRLQNLTIRDDTDNVPPFTIAAGTEHNLISIQGYMGSTPYQAFKEWQEFLDTYDPDGAILAVSDDFQKPEEYFSYTCYSQEMVDRLTEICEKYDLEPLGRPWFFDRAEDVYDAVGIESVFAESFQGEQNISGYCYQDGTFSLEGNIELTGEWNELVSFDYRSVQKTSFDSVSRNIGAVDSWDQWNYTTKDGTEVLLTLRESGGLIIVDKEGSFVTVAVLGVFADGHSYGDVPTERAFLEAFCDAFDFSFRTKTVDPVEADALYQAQLEREASGDYQHVSGGQIDSQYVSSYAAWIDYMVIEQKYQDLEYALMDINGDGVEELLLHCDDYNGQDCDESSFFALTTMRDGEIYCLIEGANFFLCQGNVIENNFSTPGWTSGHSYDKLKDWPDSMDVFTEFLVSVEYNEKEAQWRRKDNHDNNYQLVDITEEEANEIMAKYPRIDIKFIPVSEFPAE